MINFKMVGVQSALRRTPTCFLHLDPQRDAFDCVLPEHVKLQSHVILQVGANMPTPIPDLAISELGICATLSFGGRPFSVRIPWDCLLAVVDERGLGQVFDDAALEVLEKPPAKPIAPVVSLDEFRKRKAARGPVQAG